MTTLTTPAVFIAPALTLCLQTPQLCPPKPLLYCAAPTAGVALLLSELPAQALVVVWSDPE